MMMNNQKLRIWPHYTVAIIVSVAIGLAGYLVGRDNPVPPWIENFLIPALAWLGVVLILLAVGDWLRQRRRASRRPPPEE